MTRLLILAVLAGCALLFALTGCAPDCGTFPNGQKWGCILVANGETR